MLPQWSRNICKAGRLAALFGLATVLPASGISAQVPVSTRTAYDIAVRLDPVAHTLSGAETIVYRNPSGRPLSELYLHLYANAWSGRRTTFARDRSRKLAFFENPDDAAPSSDEGGGITIREVTLGGRHATFNVNETLLHVPLLEPLQPGADVQLRIVFDVRIPSFQHRFGYKGSNHAIAHWFPKLAVLDSSGWNARQQRGLGEFYSETSDYDVAITTPANYVIAAPGELVNRVENSDGTATSRWRARSVRDFAWAADSRFQVKRTQWEGVTVQYFHFEKHREAADSAHAVAVESLKFFSERYGRYPYTTFSVVESAAIGSGLGIEYPQLVMISDDLHGSNIRGLEHVVAHEAAHQWWYGLVGNDEQKEAWLDEAFASHATRAFLRAKHGTDPPIVRWPRLLRFLPAPTQTQLDRFAYTNEARFDFDREVNRPAIEYDDLPTYLVAVYNKGSLVLDQLEYLVGADTFNTVLKTYAARYQHRNANTADFRSVAEEISGRSLEVFFRQWVDGTEHLDHAVEQITTRRDGADYVSQIVLSRRGQAMLPVDLRLVLANGEELRRTADGAAAQTTLEVRAAAPVRTVELDPELRLIETNRANNFYPRKVKATFNPIASPDDAYTIMHLPFVWYDDGLLLALLLRGGRAPLAAFPHGVQREHDVTLAVAYNAGTERTTVTGLYTDRLPALGRRAFWTGRAMHRDVYDLGELRIAAYLGNHFYRGPYHALQLSVVHQEWKDAASEDFDRTPFDVGTVNKLRASYSFNALRTDYFPTGGGLLELAVNAGAQGSSGDFVTTSARAEAYQSTPVGVLALRAAYGLATPETPAQEAPQLRRDAILVADTFDLATARQMIALLAEVRLPLFGPLALAPFAKAVHYSPLKQATGGQWAGEAGIGVRLLGNAPFAFQIDLPLVVRVDGRTSRPRGLQIRMGRPLHIRER